MRSEDKQNNKADTGIQTIGAKKSWTPGEGVERSPAPTGLGIGS
jgi:hypothetical protein